MFGQRFVNFGARLFTPRNSFGRVPFQGVLYLFLWAASWRIIFGDASIPDIPFTEVLSGWTKTLWEILALGAPPVAGLAWMLICYGTAKAKLAGHWLRLSADIGMLASLVAYHVATSVYANGWRDDATIYSRYLTASCIMFCGLLVVRDVWLLIVIDRVAAGLRRGRQY